MAIDLTLTSIGSGFNRSVFNDNNTLIEAAFQNALSRDGSTPNQMLADIDLNGYNLLNVGSLGLADDVGLEDFVIWSKEWAVNAEDVLVSTAAGGNGTTDYSSLHWAAKASDSASAASTSETNAATSESNASTSETNAAASATAAAAAAASNLFNTIVTVTSADSPYTVTADTDDGTMFIVDSSGGNVQFTLPSIDSAGEGERYGFLRTSASNVVTRVPNGTDTVNDVAGTNTMTATAGEFDIFVADEDTPDNWVSIPWSQAVADEVTLTKVGSTLSVKDGGVGITQLSDAAISYDVGFIAGYDSEGVEEDVSAQEYGWVVVPRSFEMSDVYAYAETAPTGAALQFDVKLNGTTVFSTSPEIDAGSNADDGNHVFSTTAVSAGDRLSWEVTQVGSTVAGSGVMFTIKGNLT